MAARKFRLILAALVFLLFLAAFFLAGTPAGTAGKRLFSLQFSPLLSRAGSKSVFAALLLLSALFLGRIYCSVLCPAGLTQELFHRIGGLLRIRRIGHVRASRPVALLFVVSLFTLFGAAWLADFLDPIGLFGRLAAPVGNMARRNEASLDWGAWLVAGAGAVLLIAPALFRGRWFCDRLCPVGALLGVFASLGGGRVRIAPDRCVSCGQCEKLCPTRCADAAAKTIDPARCVVCLDCGAACRFGAITYGRDGSGGRRGFLKAAPAAAGMLFVSSRELGQRLAGDDPEPAYILPPGAASDTRHKLRCVACQACVLSCPVGIIRPMGASERPVLDYNRGYCQYACVECLRACPADALHLPSLEEKQVTRVGDTSLTLNRCVVVTNRTSCGACAEVCPTHAVVMVEQGGDEPTLPDFKKEHCIGCGACYHVCPAEPRAFFISPVRIQEKAVGVRLEERPGGGEDPSGVAAPEDYALPDFPF